MNIYFAHYWKDYGSKYEKECEDIIKDIYLGSNIINPKNINEKIGDKPVVFTKEIIQERLEKFFFPEIDMCDMVVVASPSWCLEFGEDFKGYYSPGVLMEKEYAVNKGKTVVDIQELKNKK